MTEPPAGLCGRCRHQRLVPNTRGSVFSLCERSRTDKRFPRYPRIPVGSCVGFELRLDGEPPAESGPATSPSGPARPTG
jgi:hypothetical protein